MYFRSESILRDSLSRLFRGWIKFSSIHLVCKGIKSMLCLVGRERHRADWEKCKASKVEVKKK